MYGVNETNGLINGQDYHKVDRSEKVDWADGRLAKITRFRLLSDPGMTFWDVSYCHGILKDGTNVTVCLPFFQLNKWKFKKEIVEYAKRDNVYAKGIGIFDALSTLI